MVTTPMQMLVCNAAKTISLTEHGLTLSIEILYLFKVFMSSTHFY